MKYSESETFLKATPLEQSFYTVHLYLENGALTWAVRGAWGGTCPPPPPIFINFYKKFEKYSSKKSVMESLNYNQFLRIVDVSSAVL